jgi:hypothetical protein
MTVSRAFEVAALHRRTGKRPSNADLALVFDALDVMFASLSKTKQRKLLPPEPGQRGRPRQWKYYEWWIGRLLARELSSGAQWSEAEETMRHELSSHGIDDVPTDESTLKLYLKRYLAGDTRPHLLPD